MLVLARLPEQAIVIDGRIKVRILEVRGDKVRVGVDAPADVRVDREEIHNLRLAERAAAGEGKP